MIDRNNRAPGRRAVTVLAHIRGQRMGRVLARRFGTVVATDAIVRDVGVIEVSGHPGNRRMTVIAIVATRDMRGMFTGSDDTVMAGETRADNLCVIDDVDRLPHNVVVAVLTDIGRIAMCRVLTGCIGAVVAAEAVVRDVRVIEVSRDPRGRRVAVVAIVTARYVRRVLAGRDRTVMAGEASTDNLCMVHDVRGRPGNVVVAILAQVGRIDVRRVLTGRVGAVMAAEAIVGDVDVIEVRRDPRCGRVAVITVGAARYVRGGLTGRRRAIVAEETGTDHLQVVHRIGRRPNDIVMAVLAHGGRVDMHWSLASRLRAVMTAEAVIRDRGMVEVGRDPAGGRVAIVTVVAARNVRRVLAGRGCAVVAGKTGADDLRMIDGVRRYPGIGVMTGLAIGRGVDVLRILAGSLNAVVTTCTGGRNIGVIKRSRCPRAGRMAFLAVFTARDVRRVLARCSRSVMTGETGTQDLQVINEQYGRPD